MKKLIGILLCLLLAPALALAAPVVEDAGLALSDGLSTLNPVTLDAGTNDNRVCYAAVEMNAGGSVTAITYNSVSLGAAIDSVTNTTANRRLSLYRVIGPATGSHSLAASISDTYSLSYLMGICLSGVDQTTPNGTIANNNSTGNPTVTVTSATGELVVDFMFYGHSPEGTVTVGAGQTDQANSTSSSAISAGISTEAGAASVDMTWTATAQDQWASIGFSVKPVSGGGGSTIRHRVIQ